MIELDITNMEFDKVYNLIKLSLYSCKTKDKVLIDTKFHHQTKMEVVPQTLTNGIISKTKQAQMEGRSLTEREINLYSDYYHVNGLGNVSLSSMEVDFSQMGENEIYWDPYSTVEADIIISKEVKAARVTTNYFNEFLVSDEIGPQNFNSIDTRILKIYNHNFSNPIDNIKDNKVKKMISHYHALKNIAITLKQNDLDIPIREVSDDLITLDPDKIIKLPKLKIKDK